MMRDTKVYSAAGKGEEVPLNDIESATASMNTSTSPAPRLLHSVGQQRPSKWLSFENIKNYSLFHTFLMKQSSIITIFVVVLAFTIIFGVYLLRLFTSETVASVRTIFVLSRVLRFLSCAFGWAHLYFIKDKSSADDSSRMKMALLSADQYILWSSMIGTLLLLVRCIEGACEEGQNEDSCNPRHEARGLPTDTLVANLFMIILLPVIFKAHRTSNLLVSYCVTFFGLIAAAIITKATADAVMIFACIFAFGMMIYDYERNMATLFLVIQGQQTYYDQLLSLERVRVSAEIEAVELRNLIGNIAHDLKTPLQAVMVELDGLQVQQCGGGGGDVELICLVLWSVCISWEMGTGTLV